ncbi:MAG: hypothetical protein SGI88_15370, partial [Candidatus Hydrogenedentes bacterium]|nr:hypothetical protein [Candidatus Hydrogenedentota bacterium]
MGRKRKIITGWRLIVLTLCAIAGFNVYDSRVINAAPLRGFYPASTSYVLSSWDFPRAWRSLLRNDAVIRMRKDWPRPYAPLELAARKKTGIRPTPSRWQLWMGKRIVFAESDEGFGITAYPGSLLRWADWVRNFAGAKPGNDGILQLGDTYYAWREGYLIASPARAYVVAAITTTDAPSPNSDNTALLTVQWMGQHPGFFHLRPGAGLPITGEVEFDARDGQRPLTLPQAWPKTPIASVTTRNSEDFAQLWRLASGWFDGSETLSELRHRAETLAKIWNVRALRPEWDTGADHVAIALFDVDTRGGIPLAEAALAMRYAEAAPQTSPFDGVLDASHVLPYEWN